MSRGRIGRPQHAIRASARSIELFIGLMTIMSLIVMVFLVFVRRPEVEAILASTDTLLCVLFLFDFAPVVPPRAPEACVPLRRRSRTSLPQGVFDLLGSIPGTGILRLFRIFRVARLTRAVRASGSHGLAKEFFKRRAESAVYVIILASFLVLLLGKLPDRDRRARGRRLQHQDRGRCILVGIRHHHHRRLWRSVPGDSGRPVRRAGHDGRRDRHLRRPHELPLDRLPRAARRRLAPAAPVPGTELGSVKAELEALRAEMAGLRRLLEVNERG